MTHSSNIPRSPSQSAFDRACDIYSAVSDVAKGEKQATAVLVDYFKSQPQDQRVARGRSLVNKAHQLPGPAQPVGAAVVHSVTDGLAQLSQSCAQARALIDKLCILRVVKGCQKDLERSFARLGLGLSVKQAVAQVLEAARQRDEALKTQLGEHAPAVAERHIYADLQEALRASALLDEAVLALLETLSAEKISLTLAAYTDEICRLSDRLHVLEGDLVRVRVAVGPAAEVRAFTRQEDEAYARLLAWTAVVHPGFHASLERLNVVPEDVRTQVSPGQLEAFLTLAKRAALSVTQKHFKPREMATLQAFRSTSVWQEIAPFVRALTDHSDAIVLHLSANLVATLASFAQAHGRELPDESPDISFCDKSALDRSHADGVMSALPFFYVGTEPAEPTGIH